MKSPTGCQCFGCKGKPGVHRRVVLVCGGCAKPIDEARRLVRNAGERLARAQRPPRPPRLCATGCGRAVWASHARYCKACSDEQRATQRSKRRAARPCGCGFPITMPHKRRCDACARAAIAARGLRCKACGKRIKPGRPHVACQRRRHRDVNRARMAAKRADEAFRKTERAKTRERMRKLRARSTTPTNQEATR